MAGQRRISAGLAALCITGLLAACTVAAPTQAPANEQNPVTQTVMPLSSPTSTLAPTQTITLAPTATTTQTNTPTPPPLALCSPLEDIALPELGQPDLLKNPFQPPRPGFDDGHQGDDFAYWSRGTHKTMLGLPVHSVLDGRVAGVIKNRKPYGNAIIIETHLNRVPDNWLVMVPTPAPTVKPDSSLFCPADNRSADSQGERSLYLLYAHLNQTPTLMIGQPVSCGEPIGFVGTTGNSVNPHLHLETRVGPTGATFTEMAHYINDATEAEMRNFCTWRVSGLFQMFDPMKLLSQTP